MVRTQIYLTEAEQQALRTLSCRTGRTRSELIREAIDTLVARGRETDRNALLKQGRGLWRNREDLADFEALRQELDRPLSERK